MEEFFHQPFEEKERNVNEKWKQLFPADLLITRSITAVYRKAVRGLFSYLESYKPKEHHTTDYTPFGRKK